MPKHADNSRLGRLRPIGQVVVFFASMGGVGAWEAVRVADARATVGSGWAAGIAAGAGGCLVLAALVVVTVLAQRGRTLPRRGGRRALLALIITIALIMVVAALSSMPLRHHGRNQAPYVITSGFEVAEMSYVAVFFLGIGVAVLAAMLVAPARKRRPSPQ